MEHITEKINKLSELNAVDIEDHQGEISGKALPVLATPAFAVATVTLSAAAYSYMVVNG